MTETSPLQTLFDPRALAVIGATERPGRVGRIIFERLLASGRPVVAVHPTETCILGQPVVADIQSLPDDIDLAVVALNAELSVPAAEACARRGIPQIIAVAGGFSETGAQGKALEQRLGDLRRQYGCRILGPNTLGIFLPRENIDTIFVEHGDRALAGGGGVAFVSQSGSVGVEALGLASNTGFGMRAFVGLGNKCDLDELDFLEYFRTDPATTCLAFYVETLGNGRRFLETARDTARQKPVAVLKAGRSAAGASAVASHTGRLAGSDQVVSGALRQYGVQRVFDDEELCDAAKTLAMVPPPAGNRVAVLTPAGGYGVMASDHIELARSGIRLRMAHLQPDTCERLRRASLPFAAVRNPVDLTASATDQMVGAALDALLADPGVDIVLCTAFFAPPGISDALVDEIARRAQNNPKPIIVFTQYGPFTDYHLLRFHRAGVVGFPSIGRAVRAVRCLVERAGILAAFEEGP